MNPRLLLLWAKTGSTTISHIILLSKLIILANSRYIYNQTPILYAVADGNEAKIKLLLDSDIELETLGKLG